MPNKPLHPCNKSGCPRLTHERFCPEHTKQEKRRYDETRGNSGKRGYDATWQKVRTMKLNQDPLCEEHLKQSIDVPATMVHHIEPVETHPELRLVMENLMSLCNFCHEALEKGGRYGRNKNT